MSRGLVGWVTTGNRSINLAGHPVTDLSLRVGPPGSGWFALDQPALGRVRTLRVDCVDAPAAAVCDELAGSEHWRALWFLAVQGSSGGHVGPLLAAVAAGRAGGLVRALEVSAETAETFAAFAALAAWPAGRLDELRLDGPVPAALARWPLARTLRRLDLSECSLGPGGLSALAAGPAWERLTDLVLPRARPRATEAGLVALARSAAFPAVTRLHIGMTSPNAAAAFADSGWPARLRVLDVSAERVSPADLLPLARALRDGPLEQLRVWFVHPGDGAIADLRDLLGPRLVNVWD